MSSGSPRPPVPAPEQPSLGSGPAWAGTDILYLLADLRCWLDFAIWFLREHPRDKPVRKDWFVEEYGPRTGGGQPGNPHVKSSVTQRVIDFVSRYSAGTAMECLPLEVYEHWFDEEEVSYPKFVALLRGRCGVWRGWSQKGPVACRRGIRETVTCFREGKHFTSSTRTI